MDQYSGPAEPSVIERAPEKEQRVWDQPFPPPPDLPRDLSEFPASPEMLDEWVLDEGLSIQELIERDPEDVDWESISLPLGALGEVSLAVQEVIEFTDAEERIIGGDLIGSLPDFPDSQVRLSVRQGMLVGSVRIPSEERSFELFPDGPTGNLRVREFHLDPEATHPTPPIGPPPELPEGLELPEPPAE